MPVFSGEKHDRVKTKGIKRTISGLQRLVTLGRITTKLQQTKYLGDITRMRVDFASPSGSYAGKLFSQGGERTDRHMRKPQTA